MRLRNKTTQYDSMTPDKLDAAAKSLLDFNLQNSTHLMRKKARRHLKQIAEVQYKHKQLLKLINPKE